MVYRIGYTTEQDEECVAAARVGKLIFSILEETQATSNRLFLTSTDQSNFRFDVAKTHPYKGNRKQPKPKHYEFIRNYLVGEYSAEVVYGEEADDALGYSQTEESIIVSIDKDLNNIPGWHYNFTNGNLYHVDSISATRNFFKQMLTGDNADNIKCINGIGKIKAGKLLDHLNSYEEMLCVVGLQYAIHEETPEERMLENGRLLWIRQHQNEMWNID